jgi:(2Fe-2S) ferredoxin/SAM-dependent methyltransferase
MPPFRHHVFACDQSKPDGLPCCAARGSAAVIEALRREVSTQGLLDAVQITPCGSVGLCEHGPNLVVYPEGTWYSGVGPADVPEIVGEHLAKGRPVARLARSDDAGLKAEIDANRWRALEAMKAREAAGALPDDFVRLVRGFQESRVVLTGLELDVFTAVGKGAKAETVARAREADPRGMTILLNALAALGLLAKKDGVFENTSLAARFLAAGSTDDARDALKHNLSLWQRWSTLTAAVRAGHAVLPENVRERGDAWTIPFIAAMHRNAAMRAPLVVEAVGASEVERMLDIGGGSGAYSIAFARANPALEAEVFDLPSVVPIADRHVKEAGLEARIRTRTGDLRSDSFGTGYDLVLVSAICHMLGPEGNRDLFARARKALVPGGRVVVQDFVVDDSGTAPTHAALFAVNMLVGTEAGSTYSEAEYRSWLEGAGFAAVHLVELPGPSDLVIGEVLRLTTSRPR